MIAAFEIARLFRRDLPPFDCSSHGHTTGRLSISIRFGSSLMSLFLKNCRHERWHSCIELSRPTYNVGFIGFVS